MFILRLLLVKKNIKYNCRANSMSYLFSKICINTSQLANYYLINRARRYQLVDTVTYSSTKIV